MRRATIPAVSMVAALTAAALPATAGAQAPTSAPVACLTMRERLAPAAFSGLRIARVDVVRRGPARWAGPLGRLAALHRLTSESRIRGELRFAAGDTVDTLRVGESMRRLRALGVLEDAELEARRCGDAGAVALRVVTTDAWTTTPELRVRSSAASVGIAERNVLGTGAGVRLGLQASSTGLGALVAARLPAVPLASLGTEVGMLSLANGSAWYALVRPRDRADAGPWTTSARFATSEREPRARPGSVFDRTVAQLLAGRRLGSGGSAATTYLLAGAETDRADLLLAAGEPALGDRRVQRHFTGLDAGLSRAAARYDTASWLLPRGLADVPRGIEGEVVAGTGRDRATGTPISHLDAWVGRAAVAPGRLVVGDAWASGFVGGDAPARASSVRAALLVRQAAPRGGWTLRAAAERLANPDPDVRALSTLDPLASTLPHPARLAEAAVAGSLERGAHLGGVTRATMIDAALFAAGSYRWDPVGAGHAGDVGVAVLGAGLRLEPARTARATLRLDVGVPVLRSGDVGRRPYVAFTVIPWLLGGREREGAGLP